MNPLGPLAKRIHDAILRHLYERQVQQGKWGADYHLAKQDVAKMVSRPTGVMSDSAPVSKGGTRRFDWGFESQFGQVLEDLAAAGYIEIRLTESNATTPNRRSRIRDYKLTPRGSSYVRETINLTPDSSSQLVVTDSSAAGPLPSDLPLSEGVNGISLPPTEPPDALPADPPQNQQPG